MSIYRRTDRVTLNDVTVDRVSQPAVASQQAGDWTQRRPTAPANGLLRPTSAWATTLPPEVQPRSLMYKFPRIANLLAAMWPDPNSFRRYVDDLLVDKRGSRQGFPVEVLRELFELRAFYESLHPGTSIPWDTMRKVE